MTTGVTRGWCLPLGLLLLVSWVSQACPDEKPRKVRVTVLVMVASEKDEKTDKKLEEIAREVRKTHPRFKGFKMVSLSDKSLAVGESDKFDLVEDQQAAITVLRTADKFDRVRLKVGPPMMGEITYSTPCGKFLPILTPYRTKGNETVLMAVRVKPCNADR
ncbi:MAG: hypothetical protein U0840_21245 [Gemmataceae bacterium]